jgi:hypothetical protein
MCCKSTSPWHLQNTESVGRFFSLAFEKTNDSPLLSRFQTPWYCQDPEISTVTIVFHAKTMEYDVIMLIFWNNLKPEMINVKLSLYLTN